MGSEGLDMLKRLAMVTRALALIKKDEGLGENARS